MKHFNNIKLLSSFREISDALEIISTALRIFAFVLVILQGVLLVKEAKKN
ncbi:MAG: hypothetical protein ACI4IQ_08255 [Eubacterium sp.]